MRMVRNGFTLVEIIIVVVILGILASIAIPKVIGPNEEIASSEGRQTLIVLLGAQKRYALENSNNYANDIASLDVDIPSSSYFNAPSILTSLGGTDNGNVASVRRNTTDYLLCIDPNGTITCHSTARCNGAVAAKCTNIHCTKGGGNQCN